MRRFIVFLGVALVSASVSAKEFLTKPDPFIVNETGIPYGLPFLPSRDTSGYTLSTLQTVNTAVRNLVIITAGQSNSVNTSQNGYVPVHGSQIDQLSIYDGALRVAKDPEIGCSQVNTPSGGNFATVLADKLIDDGTFDRVIIVCTGISGTSMADWGGGPSATTFGYAGQLMNRVPVVLGRLAAKGITQATTNVTIVVLWAQGETDGPAGTTQAQYVAAFNTWVAAVRAAGFSGRILVATETYNTGVFYGTIQTAQTAAAPSGVINNAAGIYLGAFADQLTASVCGASGSGANPCRMPDQTHWTDDGRSSFSLHATFGWRKALQNTGAPF